MYMMEIYLVKKIYQNSCLVFVNKLTINCLSSLRTKKRQSEDISHLTLVSLCERRSGLHIFTFCGPCVMINLCNKDQQDALFFLNLAASPHRCMINTVCSTRYQTRHFFNNSNTNEDIVAATSSTCYDVVTFLTQWGKSTSNFVAISSLVVKLLKKCRVW